MLCRKAYVRSKCIFLGLITLTSCISYGIGIKGTFGSCFLKQNDTTSVVLQGGDFRSGPRPAHFLVSIWEQVSYEAKIISQRCPEFIHYVVSVTSDRAEVHHKRNDLEKLTPPNTYATNSTGDCAVIMVMQSHQEGGPKMKPVVKVSVRGGWTVISASRAFPSPQARRISRVPKLLPHLFFPYTSKVLYSDIKLLETINNVPSILISEGLLSGGAHFGIVQHPVTRDVTAESDLILKTKNSPGGRPMIIASEEALALQVELLRTMLTEQEQRSFGIEGQLFARVLGNITSSSVFDLTWFEEYMIGSDRDQIAFYAAAARMKMKMFTKFSCGRFERAGRYTSAVVDNFILNIHCEFADFLSAGALERLTTSTEPKIN